MSFGIYITGYIIFIVGAAIGAHLLNVQSQWIGMGVLCFIGLAVVHERSVRYHAGLGGSHNSTLLPSGSMTQPNFPKSDSSTLSSTLQTSSRNAASNVCKSSTGILRCFRYLLLVSWTNPSAYGR